VAKGKDDEAEEKDKDGTADEKKMTKKNKQEINVFKKVLFSKNKNKLVVNEKMF